MVKKYVLVLLVLMSMGMMASAAPLAVDVQDATLYKLGVHDLTYTAVRQKNTTVTNCSLYNNVDGSWGRDTSVAVDTSITNGTNTFTIDPSWPSVGTTKLWNVKCVTNYTKSYKDATNATITFNVYGASYSTGDLNSMVVDVFGTGLFATLGWVDLLVLLAIVGVAIGVLTGVLFKVGKILGLG